MRISDWSSDVCSSDLRDQLAEAARLHRDNGFTALKSVVAVDKGGWREDARRVRIIREAVGDDIDLMIDANYLFNRSEEHTSELQSLMRISYAVFCLKQKHYSHKHKQNHHLISLTHTSRSIARTTTTYYISYPI